MMILIALSSPGRVFWEVAIGLGLVVILVVIALLTLLYLLVRDIDVGVASLWTVTKGLAQNTTATYQLEGTASLVLALRDELICHNKMFPGP